MENLQAIDKDGNYVFRTLSEMEGIATEQNLKLVLPKQNELFIDIDNQDDQRKFDKNYTILLKAEPMIITYRKPSKSNLPFKRHIIIQFNRDLQPLERILYQIILGSDINREEASFFEEIFGAEVSTCFFELNEQL